MDFQTLLARLLATAGNAFNQPDRGYSERISGNVLQDQPFNGPINPAGQTPGGISPNINSIQPYTPQNTGVPNTNASPIDLQGYLNGAANSSTQQKTGGGGGNNNNINTSVPSTFGDQIKIAQDAANLARQRASDAFNQAQSVYSQGVDLLGKRKMEFQNIYDQGKNTILDTYQGARGNLQASAENAKTAAANSLRALGVTGGSAGLNYEGRQRQENAKQLGSLETQRNTNENTNTSQFNANQDWANTQQDNLTRYLQNAKDQQNAAGNTSDLVARGDVAQIQQNQNNWLANIQANQDALAAAKSGISGYASNPFTSTIGDYTNTLNTISPTTGTDSSGLTINPNQSGVNIQDPTLLSMLDPKYRSGLFGAGLYNA